jgi:hypothetical protein
MTAAPMAMPINAVCSSLSFMVSLRLSSSERLAKDTICSISNSPSLRLTQSLRQGTWQEKNKLSG